MDFVDTCYLIKHAQGWFLWDTGVSDAIAAMPNGQAPADPRATHWRRPKTLASQLDALGVKPSDIKWIAISHTHNDHIGNVEMFPQAMLLVRLPKTGTVLLSGDAVHFKSNWENRGVPVGNFGQEQTKVSMQKMADVLAKEKAQLWINHDKAQRDSQKMSPDFYE